MKISILLTLLIISSNGISQDRTDISLFLKKNRDVLLTEVESTSGNMFKKAGHHGPDEVSPKKVFLSMQASEY